MATGLINNCCTPQKLRLDNNSGYLSITDGNSVFLGTLIKSLGITTPVIDFRISGYIITLVYTDAQGVIQTKTVDISAVAQGGAITVTDTASVNLTFASANLSANVNISSFAGNSIVTKNDGLWAPALAETPLVANPSSTLLFVTSGVDGHTLTGSVKISSNPGNKIQVAGDGLLVGDMTTYILAGTNITLTGVGSAGNPYIISSGGFADTPLSVNDSSSFHFISSGTAGHTLTGNVKISTVSANAIILNSDGLYVPQASTNSYSDVQARAAISAISPILYNNITGVISESLASASSNGYLSSTDWISFNSKIALVANVGSGAAFSIYAGQTGTTANLNAIRAGSNVTINQVGNDLVINATGGSSGSAAVFNIDFIIGDGGALTPTSGASQFNPSVNPLVGKTILGVFVEGLKIAGVPRTGGALYFTFTSTTGTITLTNGVFSDDTYYSILYK